MYAHEVKASGRMVTGVSLVLSKPIPVAAKQPKKPSRRSR